MNTPTDAPWSAEQVTALAPDAQVSKAGLKLAAPGTWSRPGTDGTLLWGAARGSGKNPYKVCVDLTGPAFTCSCPSRKIPCKHTIGLLHQADYLQPIYMAIASLSNLAKLIRRHLARAA